MIGTVRKDTILAHCKKPLRVGYYLRGHGVGVPCTIILNLAHCPAKEGMVWIKVKEHYGTSVMQFMVPEHSVLTRSRFLRPMVPISLWRKVKELEAAIKDHSREHAHLGVV